MAVARTVGKWKYRTMGLKVFQIVFDNPTETYYAGQSVSGSVLLSLASPKTIRGGWTGYITALFNHNNIVWNFELHENGIEINIQ
jgi:hypothetical protein